MTLTTVLASVPLTAGSHQAGAMGGSFVFGPFGFLLMALLVGAVGYLIVRALRSEGDPSERRTGDALDTLRRRYANGEIDDEEYQTRKNRLVR